MCLEFYIDLAAIYIPNMETYLYHWNQNRNQAENKGSSLENKGSSVEVFIYLRLFMFDYRALLVCVTDKTCLRIAIPPYCFNIFRSIFGPVLFT